MKHFRQKKQNRQTAVQPPLSKQGKGICPVCGARLPAGRVSACPICGTHPGARRSRHPAPSSPLPVQPATDVPLLRRTVQTGMRMIFGFLLALAAVVGTLQYVQHQAQLTKYTANLASLYTQRNTLQLAVPGISESFPIAQNATAAQVRAEVHSGGRYLAYHANDYGENRLYLLDLLELENPSGDLRRGTLLASDVADFRFSTDGLSLVYLTHHGNLFSINFSTFALPFLSNRVDPQQLDSDVAQIEACEGDYVLYRKAALGEYFALYGSSTSAPAPRLIAERAQKILDIGKGMEQIIFTARGDWNGLGAVLYNSKQQRTTLLASNIALPVSASADNQQLLYLTRYKGNIPGYRDLIFDDLQTGDAAMADPDTQGFAASATYDEYIHAEWDWEDKLARDDMRRLLQQEVNLRSQNYFSLFDLQLYSRGRTTTLDKGLCKWGDEANAPLLEYDAQKNVLLYRKCYPDSLQPIALSALDPFSQDYGLPELLPTALPEELVYLDLGTGETQTVHTGNGTQRLQAASIAENTGIYYTVAPSASQPLATLFFAPLRGGDVRNSHMLDTQVLALLEYSSRFLGGSQLYLTAPGGGAANLCAALQEHTALLAQDIDTAISPPVLPQIGDTILYYRSTASSPRSLYSYRDRENWLADDVQDLSFAGSNQFYYLTKGAYATGALYFYDNGNAGLQDDSVSALVHPRTA
jgi:hypothetical protein